jgi:tetratricopeptide (TPR) repeat protein
VEDNPENAWAWLGLAQEHRASGPAGLDDHLRALTAVLALLPGEPTAGPLYAGKAEALLELGRPDEAATAARQALSLNGRLLKPHWILALAAERRGAWAEARDHLHTILRRLEPDHPEAPVIRARLNAAERALGGGARR